MGEYYCTGNTAKHLKNHNHQQSASVHNDLFQSSVIFCFINTTKHPLFEFLLLWGAYVPPLPRYLDSSTLLLLYKPPNAVLASTNTPNSGSLLHYFYYYKAVSETS